MFYLICIILCNFLTQFTTTTNAINYITIPTFLQHKNQEKIAYDHHTSVNYVMFSNNGFGPDGIQKKIYTCRIGASCSQGIMIDCFPFPSHGAIPKHHNEHLATKMCEYLAEMYVAYCMGAHLVWCDKPFAEAVIPNGAVKVLQVPHPLNYEFGKTVIYDYRSTAIYQMESYWAGQRVEKTFYICRIGEFNFRDNGDIDQLMTHCPYPQKNKASRGEREGAQVYSCKVFASKFAVYWLNGRIVFCMEKEKHNELDLIKYHKGVKTLQLTPQESFLHGKVIYYDNTTANGIVHQIEEISNVVKGGRNKMIYKCIIGGLDYKNEFSVCFPQRNEQKRTEASSYVEAKNECESLAERYQLYWENNRLVWCTIEKNPQGRPKKASSSSASPYQKTNCFNRSKKT